MQPTKSRAFSPVEALTEPEFGLTGRVSAGMGHGFWPWSPSIVLLCFLWEMTQLATSAGLRQEGWNERFHAAALWQRGEGHSCRDWDFSERQAGSRGWKRSVFPSTSADLASLPIFSAPSEHPCLPSLPRLNARRMLRCG